MKTIKLTSLALFLLASSLVSERAVADAPSACPTDSTVPCEGCPADNCKFERQTNPSTGVVIESMSCRGAGSMKDLVKCKRDFTRMNCGSFAACETTEGWYKPVCGSPELCITYPAPCRWKTPQEVPGAWRNTCPEEKSTIQGCVLTTGPCKDGNMASIDLSAPIYPSAHVEAMPGGDRYTHGLSLMDNHPS